MTTPLTRSRCWLCALLAALCAGCGGGETPHADAPRVIEWYGDSLTFGSIAGPSGELTRLSVPPVRRAQELLGAAALCVDLSLPGATVADALAGVAMMPFGRFADHVAATAAQTLVIRYGGADAIRGTPLPDFERDLSALVTLAQAAGKTVWLVGVIATPTGVTDDFDLAVERTADAFGVGFVNVRAVSVTFPDDLADGVHPAQAWSDRLTAAIVRPLQPQP
jgi:acyl-CoA thioesterase-1